MGDLRLVIFDVDGTLVDSQGHILAAMETAFAACGRAAPDRAAVLSIVGLSLPHAMAQLAPDTDDAGTERLVGAYRQAFSDLRQSGDPRAMSPLYPGARATLQALHARDEILIGLATGKSRRGVDAMLEAHDLQGMFVTRQVADDHPSKPHPSMVMTALAETGVAAADAVVIGDTTYDMEMARQAGVPGIGVGWGYHPPQALLHSGAMTVLEEYAGLLPVLNTLWGQVR